MPRPRPALALVLALAVWPAPARGGGDDRVPLAENFTAEELGATAVLSALNLGLALAEPSLVELRDPALGVWGWDEAISDALYPGPGAGRFGWGVPDLTGEVALPAVTIGFYAADALALWGKGTSISGDPNADHELFALLEGYSATVFLTEAAKLGVGRTRPVLALDRPDPPDLGEEATLSFFSGHTSSSFYLAAFLWRDLSDWLVYDKLGDATDGTRLWAGRIAPAAALYGVAGVVGLSRIIDQRHYFSDVLVGALVGGAAGNLAYALHFDGAGRPRRRHGPGRLQVVAGPGGVGVAGAF